MSESTALIPATDPATAAGGGDPKKDEATAKKRRAGFISRLRGMFGESGEDFEKQLKYLSKEEASFHARMKRRAQSSRKTARNIICLGVSLEVSKHSRSSTRDTFGPEGTVINTDIEDPYKSVTNNSNIAGVTNNLVNPEWDWDADDGALSNVEILLSEFGDLGDFFEDDDLTFGEVQVSSVTSLLQSDIKVALKAAFGGLDDPLSVIDWCKGRSQPGDAVSMADLYSFQCTAGEAKDSASFVTLVGEPISPPQSTGGSSFSREGARNDESTQRRLNQEVCNAESEQLKYSSRFSPTLSVLPLTAILVGYQDDWLKTSANCLQLWEKAPLEPYALPKPVNYYALYPNIDLLSSAAADFFQQLGTIYEACKLGTHSPQMSGGQVEISLGRCLPSGLVLVDYPEQVKVAGSSVCSISSTSEFFQTLSKGWSVKS